ncbi:MAG: cation-translocating P-type ATPase [Gammaproteobacteria bacterium]|nr:cation-translocating P-type ATPase [Gammaproteobacteria bacterium]
MDESMLTGEYLPKLRREGDSVIGGTISVDNPLRIRVTRTGNDSLQARIQRLVERAQTEKPRITRIADRVAGWFVMAVLLMATMTALAWLWIDPQNWLPITIAVLVVSCPCALSLATPTALTAALSGFLQRGLAVTRVAAIESLTRTSHVAFDKTGTLTQGRLSLRRVETCAELSRHECLKLAAVLESQSEHPVAKALIEAYGSESVILPLDLCNHPGAGLSGVIDGRRYFIGKPEFIEDNTGLACRRPLAVLSNEATESLVILASEEKLLAAFVLVDSLRAGARELVEDIHRSGRETVLLSGDHRQVVRSVGMALDIGDCRSGLSPDDKLAQVRDLQHRGAVIAMVGDGINDAPVLAAANVSIVMRRGADISRGQADVLMLGEDIRCLGDALRLADKTVNVIRQNISWALAYNLLALPLAMAGYVEPWMAAVGMSCSSLLVLANSSRLGAKPD